MFHPKQRRCKGMLQFLTHEVQSPIFYENCFIVLVRFVHFINSSQKLEDDFEHFVKISD